MSLKKSYLKYCKDKDLEINKNQIKIVQKLNEYYNLNFKQSFFKKIFNDKKNKFKNKKMNIKKLFINHCEDQQYEINQNQLDIINYLRIYYSENFTQYFFSKFFKMK